MLCESRQLCEKYKILTGLCNNNYLFHTLQFLAYDLHHWDIEKTILSLSWKTSWRNQLKIEKYENTSLWWLTPLVVQVHN